MTLEEKAIEYSIYQRDKGVNGIEGTAKESFIEGAEWQAEQDREKAINAIKGIFCYLINGEWDCEYNDCEKDCRQMKEFIEQIGK